MFWNIICKKLEHNYHIRLKNKINIYFFIWNFFFMEWVVEMSSFLILIFKPSDGSFISRVQFWRYDVFPTSFRRYSDDSAGSDVFLIIWSFTFTLNFTHFEMNLCILIFIFSKALNYLFFELFFYCFLLNRFFVFCMISFSNIKKPWKYFSQKKKIINPFEYKSVWIEINQTNFKIFRFW